MPSVFAGSAKDCICTFEFIKYLNSSRERNPLRLLAASQSASRGFCSAWPPESKLDLCCVNLPWQFNWIRLHRIKFTGSKHRRSNCRPHYADVLGQERPPLCDQPGCRQAARLHHHCRHLSRSSRLTCSHRATAVSGRSHSSVSLPSVPARIAFFALAGLHGYLVHDTHSRVRIRHSEELLRSTPTRSSRERMRQNVLTCCY